MKPLIGITPSPSQDEMPHGSFLRHSMAAAYVDAVLAAGGIPVVLPPQDGHSHALLDRLDGVLLSGGGDIEPERYNATSVHATTYGINVERDRFEIELAQTAIERDLPLFGICRGIQVLNVALGGTLIQDVASEVTHPAAPCHRQHESGLASDQIGHPVTLAANTLVADAYPESTVGVNSFHHQAIGDLAPGLEPAAWSPDGLIEAVVLPAARCCLAVQWHPELMFVRHPVQLALFTTLVDAARRANLAVVAN